jgi:hypothetical protein
MDIMGIEYKRKFKLNSLGVYNAINNDIYISFYDGKIRLPLSKIRGAIRYFPIKKDGILDFKASNPLLRVVKTGSSYTIHYGNRRLSKLNADYLDYDSSSPSVKFQIDGKEKDIEFGTIVNVKDSFLVKDDKNYRINVIGYTNNKKETNVKIKRSQIMTKHSIDKNGYVYRVEYYMDEKFAGMVLVKFAS